MTLQELWQLFCRLWHRMTDLPTPEDTAAFPEAWAEDDEMLFFDEEVWL